MSFELQVTFGGLCFYAPQPGGKHIAILLPDAREKREHADGSVGNPHVGYLSVSPVHLAPQDSAVATALAALSAELVFRFSRSHLRFDSLEPESFDEAVLPLPDLDNFAPCLQLKHAQKLFSKDVPADLPLLMRTVITGGVLSGDPKGQWQVPLLFHPDGEPQQSSFAGHIFWDRTVHADTLSVTITDFAGSPQTALTLHPVDGVIKLRIANLCSDNPLEWEEFKKPETPGDDIDFKWFYHLLEPTADCGSAREERAAPTYPELLLGTDLPVPRPAPPSPFGGEHCIGVKGTVDLPGTRPPEEEGGGGGS